ncbi:anti-sigma factor family protein [Cupriavidus necator]|uniref:anti-sigma factor family protein n=1 Tax=Cupriavidus necator TaxID=106590 RepID=UPI002784508F|nr:anti-sigma factor [Cupriavidus necator]MDQ0141844.1 anti-sigma factor RsiW [Cupriavidus necator]
MDCNDVCELLPACADDELGAAESLRLEQHLAQCAACTAELGRLRALRTAVREGATYHRASPALRAGIAAALPAARVPAGGEASRPRWLEWFAWRPAVNAGLAALTVASMAFGLTLFLLREAPQDAMAREVVSGHVRALIADHAIDVASTDRHTVKPWFNGRLDFAPPVPDMAAEGFALVGGRLDYLHGQRVAVLVYRRNQHPIDVFVLRGAGARKAAPDFDSTLTRQGYQITHWQAGGMDYWAVTDASAADLQRFGKAWRMASGGTP